MRELQDLRLGAGAAGHGPFAKENGCKLRAFPTAWALPGPLGGETARELEDLWLTTSKTGAPYASKRPTHTKPICIPTERQGYKRTATKNLFLESNSRRQARLASARAVGPTPKSIFKISRCIIAVGTG